MSAPLWAAVAALGAGTLAAIPRATLRAAIPLQLAGAAVLAAGAIAVMARGTPVGAAFGDGLGPSFGLDGLSAFFLAVVSLAAVPALLAASDALRGSALARPLTALTGLFVLALAGVLAARDALTFLAFWELMTLVPASAILVARRDAPVRNAVFVYLAITHVGGAGVWLTLLTLAREGVLGGGAALGGGLQALVVVAAIVGFGTKAGLAPLHAWLPRAHPVAPAHVSALMSGVMIKVALYGLIRVLFEWCAPAPLWAGLALLALGLVSTLAGVLYALVQRELKRLLAFSSIENVGVIAVALGASLVLADVGRPRWAAVAFGAALLHVAAHAAFKTLLFLGAGAFSDAVGKLDLDRLGGLLTRMPGVGRPFLAGCAAIAGVPILSGFASEWLTLQSLLRLAFDDAAGVAVAGALAAAGVAAGAALALFCFVKVAGLVLLGAPRTEVAAAAVDRPPATRGALAALAAACLALGLLPALLLPELAALMPGAVAPAAGAAIDLPGTGGLPPIGLAVALALVAGGVLALTRRRGRAEAAPAWACGQREEPALQWTSAGFTKTLRLVLESVLRPEREVTVHARGGVVAEVTHRAEVPHLFDTALYGPLWRGAQRAAGVARRLQSGSLRMYLGYLAALVVALLALVRIGVLG